MRSAHYRFVPTQHMLNGEHGSVVEGQTAYVPILPTGAAVNYIPTESLYELKLSDIPAAPVEEFMPPMQAMTYRVQFYYTAILKVEDYWKDEGKYWRIPHDAYPPIHQAAVVLKSSKNQVAARVFLAFIQSPPAREVFLRYGFVLPEKR